jgi:hypothetical protein
MAILLYGIGGFEEGSMVTFWSYASLRLHQAKGRRSHVSLASSLRFRELSATGGLGIQFVRIAKRNESSFFRELLAG